MRPAAAREPHRLASAGGRRGFRDALRGEGVSVIAEIKRRSPSRGALRAGADAVALARAYEAGGAACVSVLTDGERFDGSAQDLRDVRAAVGVPVLRKDFLTSEQDIRETREMGADAALVIVADVAPVLPGPLHELAFELGLDVLTEIRTESELEAAAECGADMIAVNQRNDPKDAEFTVEYDKAARMGPLFDQLGPGIVKVAASGIGVPGGTTIAEIAAAGYDAALIGEALVVADDPAATLRSLGRSATEPRPVPAGRSRRSTASL